MDRYSVSRKVSFRVPVTEVIRSDCNDDEKEVANEKGSGTPNEELELDPESGTYKQKSPLRVHNIWKIICLSMVIGAFIFYVVLLSYNFFFEQLHHSRTPYEIKERDVFTFFAYAKNETRYAVVSKIMKEYGMKSNVINPFYDPVMKQPQKHRLSPRYNDTRINTVENRFSFINNAYSSDAEVQKLMEEDGLAYMFASMAYSPAGVIEPQCGCSKREVLLDVARLSTVTGSVRTYGTQCHQAEYILEAIKELNVNLTLALGVWIGSNEYTNSEQMATMKELVAKYPREYFHSIYIGNEVLFRNDMTPKQLAEHVREAKGYVTELGLDIPVGTSEIGSRIAPELYESCDFVGANIHPFFGGVEAQHGTRWVLDYYYGQLIPERDNLGYNTKLIVSEVGWPYAGGDFFKASAGAWEFQQFLNDWFCTTPAEILNNSVFFEAFDEPWKRIWWDSTKRWETEWGFFTSDRELKGHVYVPDCTKYGTPEHNRYGNYDENFDPYEEVDE